MVELTVRVGPRSATAKLTVSPSCATDPLTPVNTIAVVNGVEGMTVGTCFFEDPSLDPGPRGFHFLVLYRNTNNSYGVPLTAYIDPTKTYGYNFWFSVDSANIGYMQTYLSTLPTDGTVLVFMALPAGAPTVPSSLIGQLNSALAKIGGVVPPTYLMQSGNSACWGSNIPSCWGSPTSMTLLTRHTISLSRTHPNHGMIKDMTQGPSR